MGHDIHSSTDDYAQRFAGPVGAFFTEVEVGAIRKALSPWSSASIIDIGGGHARTAPPLAEDGHRLTITGSDASCGLRPSRLMQCPYKFVECEPSCLPFADQSFDIAISTRQMAHEEEWAKMLSEMTRVARKAVLIDYPSKRSLNSLSKIFFGLKKRVERNTRHYRSFHDREIDSAFRDRGCLRLSRTRLFFLPMALYRMIGIGTIARLFESIGRSLGLVSGFGSPVIAVYVPDQNAKQ